MFKPENTKEYMKAVKIGFDYYGLNRFYEMHKDVCNNPDNPWGYALTPLNDLSYEEFDVLVKEYLSNTK